MKKMHIKLICAKLALREKQKGLTTVEYAVAGALVAASVVAAFQLLGEEVTEVINYLAGVIAT